MAACPSYPPTVGSGEIARVYKAYLTGSRTTAEVAAITRLPVRICSAYTSTLVARGFLRKAGVGYVPMQTVQPTFYEPVTNPGQEYRAS